MSNKFNTDTTYEFGGGVVSKVAGDPDMSAFSARIEALNSTAPFTRYGVIAGLLEELMVVPTDPVGFSVNIRPGGAMIGPLGSLARPYLREQAGDSISIDRPSASERTDIVGIRLINSTTRTNFGPDVITGTPASGIPAIGENTEQNFFLPLAYVTVRVGATEVRSTDIRQVDTALRYASTQPQAEGGGELTVNRTHQEIYDNIGSYRRMLFNDAGLTQDATKMYLTNEESTLDEYDLKATGFVKNKIIGDKFSSSQPKVTFVYTNNQGTSYIVELRIPGSSGTSWTTRATVIDGPGVSDPISSPGPATGVSGVPGSGVAFLSGNAGNKAIQTSTGKVLVMGNVDGGADAYGILFDVVVAAGNSFIMSYNSAIASGAPLGPLNFLSLSSEEDEPIVHTTNTSTSLQKPREGRGSTLYQLQSNGVIRNEIEFFPRGYGYTLVSVAGAVETQTNRPRFDEVTITRIDGVLCYAAMKASQTTSGLDSGTNIIIFPIDEQDGLPRIG